MKYFLLIWMLCPLASLHAAGPGIRIACYNAESLHDTIPDRLIDDGDYTPRGARQWNGERYRLKIGHIAPGDRRTGRRPAVADRNRERERPQGPDARNFLRLQLHSPAHVRQARYGHRAAVPRKSVFSRARPSDRRPGLPRELLVVDGLLDGEPLTLIGAHLPSQLNRASYRLRALGTLRKARRFDLAPRPTANCW